MELNVGLDLGSTAIKIVFTQKHQVLWQKHVATAPGQENVARAVIKEGLHFLGLEEGNIKNLVSTGYGKKLFSTAHKNIDEISANALGLFHLSDGRVRTIINIGGQDLKVLTLSDSGQVTDFKMNDKCAAGTGRFFELAARILDTPLEDFCELCQQSKNDIELNSTCAVFAESEIVSLLARDVAREDIVKALHRSVARRVAGLMGRSLSHEPIYLDGGPAQNRGLVEALEDELMAEVCVVDAPQFTVAYGAAIS